MDTSLIHSLSDAIFHPSLVDWLMQTTAIPSSSVNSSVAFHQNILGQFTSAWNHFIASGQAWSFFIGLALGYIIRSLTSFG